VNDGVSIQAAGLPIVDSFNACREAQFGLLFSPALLSSEPKPLPWTMDDLPRNQCTIRPGNHTQDALQLSLYWNYAMELIQNIYAHGLQRGGIVDKK
jgi:hypothetical protein